MACAKRKVLYVDLETDKRTLQRRIAEVCAAKGAPAADVKANLSVWPLYVEDMTGLLETCKPNYDGLSEARRQRIEADNADKLAKLEAKCDQLIGDGSRCYREDVERELGWSTSTVNRWLEKSERFERHGAPGKGKSKIVRKSGENPGP